MKNKIISLALIAGLAACSGGNPFDETDTATDGGTTGGTGGDTDGGTVTEGSTGNDGIDGIESPPSSAAPQPSDKLVRYEAKGTSEDNADGFVRDVRYDAENDTFIVDNLAFDSANIYVRGDPVSSLGNGQYQVYESTTPFPDSVTDDSIEQFSYRAIYGVSKNKNAEGIPATQFAIVRSSSFRDYGFGGFIYQRNGTVTLPESGQATFTGQTAGVRDFDGIGGRQYTSGRITIDIDFRDFSDEPGIRGDGVKGRWSDRRIFNENGDDITVQIAGQLNTNMTELPVAEFIIRPGALRDSGDLSGEVQSSYFDASGRVQDHETGNYYAVVSGDNPDEITGVLVITNTNEAPDGTDYTARETAGFIAYRGANN